MNNSEFRPMRRIKQQLTNKESRTILTQMTSGVLALQGDNQFPYAVPISYVLHDDLLYMHSALSGHKVDALRLHPKASFCVIAKDEILPERFTTLFRSVIAFGELQIVADAEEKLFALKLLSEKYCPCETDQAVNEEVVSGMERMLLLRFRILHLTGKEAIELVTERRKDHEECN